MREQESNITTPPKGGPLINAGAAIAFLTERIYLTVLSFDCVITGTAGRINPYDLPFFLGPALRGAFGYVLKEYCCDNPDPYWREEIKDCPHRCDCAYKTVFLSPAPSNLPP